MSLSEKINREKNDIKKTLLELWEAYKGPPVDLEAIIRALGLELDKKADLGPNIAGMIEPTESGTHRIRLNGNDNRFRQRFAMAHALGHHFYHRELIGEGIVDMRDWTRPAMPHLRNPRILPYHEAEANKFAVEFLMPRDVIERIMGQGVADPKILAQLFLVTPSAMSLRLEGLANSHVPVSASWPLATDLQPTGA